MQKRKIMFNDMPNYYRTATFTIVEGGKQIPGVLYFLDQEPTEGYKREIQSRYDNVKWMISRPEYAPEQRKPCLFVGRDCF